jgi:hypothetical protein
MTFLVNRLHEVSTGGPDMVCNKRIPLVLGASCIAAVLCGCAATAKTSTPAKTGAPAPNPPAPVPSASVSLSPTSASVAPSQSQLFNAVVQNDVQNKGVVWALTQSGIACSPQCGTIPGYTTQTAVYVAPASAPSTTGLLITATSLADGTQSASAAIAVTFAIPSGVSDQWVDITKYGARSVTTAPTATAACTSDSTEVTLTNGVWPQDFTQFDNGDSVRLDNCGPPTAMTPPTGVSVSPGMNAGGTPAVSGLSLGTTAYSYQVIACDQLGGCSAASTTASTTSGAANLGQVTATISKMSLSNNKMTVTTKAPHGFANNAMVHIQYFSTQTASFEGSYIVSSVPSATTFTFLTSIDSRVPGTPTLDTSGGVVVGFNCNVMSWNAGTNVWKYFIYGRTSASRNLIGVAEPGTTSWQDYGSPIMDNMHFPSFVTVAPPTTPLNQYLLTTISGGGGTGSIRTAAPAANTVANVAARMGSDAAILAAFKAAQYGTLFIPAGTFQAAGYLDLHAFGPLYVLQGGALVVADTVQIPGGLYWRGWAASAPTQFQESPTPFITGLRGSYPTLYLGANTGGTVEFDHAGINSYAENGALLFYADSGAVLNFNYVVFANAGGPGYMHRQAIFRTGGFDYNFSSCDFIATQPTGAMSDMGAVFLPSILFAPRGSTATGKMLFSTSWFVGKSAVEVNSSGSTNGEPGAMFYNVQTQNGLLPVYVASNFPNSNTVVNRAASFDGFSPADYPTPMTGNWAANTMSVSLQNLANVPTGSRPLVVGNPTMFASQGGGTATSGPPGGGWYATGGSQVGYLLPPPAGPPMLTVNSGGSVPVGSHTYQTTWIDGFSNSTTAGPSATINIVAGMQTVDIAPPAAPDGAVGWQYYRDGALAGPSSTVCGPFGIGTTQIDSLAFPACGNSTPSQNNAMSSGQGINGEETTKIALTGGGHETVISGTFSADRNLTVPDVSGTIAVKIANGTVVMPSDALAANTCGTVIQAVAPGVLPTDVVHSSPNSVPSANVVDLKVRTWSTTNNVTFQYCNGTDVSITPTPATLNWQVIR